MPKIAKAGSVSRTEEHDPALDSSDDVEYRGGKKSSTSKEISVRVCRVGNKIHAPKSARDRKQDEEQFAARSVARSKQTERCDFDATNGGIRLLMRSKLTLRVRSAALPARAPSSARSRDRTSGPLERDLQVSGIPMSICTRQILGGVCKPVLAQQS